MEDFYKGFVDGVWSKEINVRNFIQKNYTPYDGDESFLAGPTDATLKLWDQVMDLTRQEREAGGVLDMDTHVISTITSHAAGYLNKDLETIVGFQTDKPTNGSVTNLVIGSGSYIDGFEDGLIGAALGETVELHLHFPDPYPNNTDLSGQPVTFKVTVASISETQLPEYNDYFVATVSDYSTVEEYGAAVALQLYTQNADSIKNEKIDTIWTTVASTSTIHQYPQVEVDLYLQEMMDYYNEYAVYSGYESLDAMLAAMYGSDTSAFTAELQSTAEAAIMEDMILLSIINKEGITLTLDEYEEGALVYAGVYGMSDVASLENEYGRDAVIKLLLWEKTLDYLLENAREIDYNTIAGGESAAE